MDDLKFIQKLLDIYMARGGGQQRLLDIQKSYEKAGNDRFAERFTRFLRYPMYVKVKTEGFRNNKDRVGWNNRADGSKIYTWDGEPVVLVKLDPTWPEIGFVKIGWERIGAGDEVYLITRAHNGWAVVTGPFQSVAYQTLWANGQLHNYIGDDLWRKK